MAHRAGAPHNGALTPFSRSQPLLPSTSEQRWQLPAPVSIDPELRRLGLPDPLLALLLRRGHTDRPAIEALLDPPAAPDPARHFPQLRQAVQRLRQACKAGETVAICGDYDADGMTSTALLVGVLQRLGARAVAAIPSRQDDGYGLNSAMVERLAEQGIRLLVTVDNGVAAREALERAEALAVAVIVTDHHTLPAELPPCLALLHPAVQRRQGAAGRPRRWHGPGGRRCRHPADGQPKPAEAAQPE